ncbi:hypothetical protein HDE_03194 [Halotydeus destructor]|nr:hypothetical protein HDE_03194 [Halotydeus destructor]
MFCSELTITVKQYMRSDVLGSHSSSSPTPIRHPTRTVFGLTRDEIDWLRSVCSCNFVLFVFSLTLLTVLGVLNVLDRYPFTDQDARAMFYVFASLLVMHILVNFLGFASTQHENTLAIDIYCVLSGIVIVCDLIMLLYFLRYAEAKVIVQFKSLSYPMYVAIGLVCSNCILMAAATVIEVQIRTHGKVKSRSITASQSVDDLLNVPLS